MTTDTDTSNIVSLDEWKDKHRKHLTLPRPVPLIDAEWDDEAGQMVPTIHAGDPGDES